MFFPVFVDRTGAAAVSSAGRVLKETPFGLTEGFTALIRRQNFAAQSSDCALFPVD